MNTQPVFGHEPIPDFYEILGVPESASQKEIKAAFRRKALRFHPDKNPGDPKAMERFRRIKEASTTLCHEPSRRTYDNLRQELARQGAKAYRNWVGKTAQEPYKPDKTPARQKRTEIHIGIEEAEKGCRRNVLWNGAPCELEIPPGVVDGQVLRFQRGGEGPFARQQYLFLEIRMQNDLAFRCLGIDLFCHLILDLHTALLGGLRLIRLPNGQLIRVQIDPVPGEQTEIRLKGMGLQCSSSMNRKGDLYIRLNVAFPRRLRPEEKDILNLLARVYKSAQSGTGS